MADYLKNLTEEQAQVANEIVIKAKQMGIDPRLALAVAYRESRLNPNTKNGTSGEIGLMQVMPKTAEGMGFSVDDLRDPAKNIEIGLTYLKQGIEKFGDPMLAVAGYNAGHNHPYFTDPENKALPDSTKEYLREINQNGGFETTPVQGEGSGGGAGGGGGSGGDASENDFKMRMLMDAAGITGGAITGKVSDIGRGVIGGARDVVRASRTLPGALGVMESLMKGTSQVPPAPPTTISAPTAQADAPTMPRPVAGGPAGPVSAGPVSPLTQMAGQSLVPTDPVHTRQLQGTTEEGATGRARQNTYNENTAQTKAMKQTQGDVLSKLQKLGVVTQSADELYAKAPRMTASPSGVLFPADTVYPQTTATPSTTAPLSSAATAAPTAPPVPPQPGALSQAGAALKQGAGAVLRSPLAQGAMGGLSIAESAMEADRQIQAKDTTGAGIAAAGIGGGAMQIFGSPKVKAIGALISAASPLTLYLRENLRKQTPMPDPTEEELLAAQMPAFNMYPRPTSGPVLRPRMP